MAQVDASLSGDLVARLMARAASFEFSTFVIGFERKFGPATGLDDAALRQLKVAVGVELENRWPGRVVDFRRPELRLDVGADRSVRVRAAPAFFGGRYRKLSRRLSASAWRHLGCRGHGCPACAYTGRRCESVQDHLTRTLLAATGGSRVAFHGLGREDVDARMLGEGRPFVLEVADPERRSLDVPAIERALEGSSGGRFEVWGLTPVDRSAVALTKEAGAEKTYRAWIRFESAAPRTIAAIAESFAGRTIDQRSPARVARRRGTETIRRRRIIASRWVGLVGELAVWELRAESGTYIKELVSGDGGRTEPSLASAAGVPAHCAALDVLAVHWTPPWERADAV